MVLNISMKLIPQKTLTRVRPEYRCGRGRRRPKAQDRVDGVRLEGRGRGDGLRGRRLNVLGHVTLRAAREVHDCVLTHGGGGGRRHVVRFTAPLTSGPICRELLGD